MATDGSEIKVTSNCVDECLAELNALCEMTAATCVDVSFAAGKGQGCQALIEAALEVNELAASLELMLHQVASTVKKSRDSFVDVDDGCAKEFSGLAQLVNFEGSILDGLTRRNVATGEVRSE